MKFLLAVSRGIEAFLCTLSRIAAFALLGLIAVVVYDVTTRRLFGMGSTQLQEAEWHLHTILIMFFLGTTYIYDRHVRIDLVSLQFQRRTRAAIELLGIILLVLPFCAVTGYYAVDFAWTSFVRNEISQSVNGLPYRWAIKAMLPVGIFLLALAALARALRAIVALRDPEAADLNAVNRRRL